MTRTALRLAPVVLAALLAACASPGPQRDRDALLSPAAAGATASSADWPAERWWSRFGDAGLDALVDRALAGTPTLQSAEARVRAAQAAVGAANAARAPQAALAVELNDQRFTENGLVPPPLAGTIAWNNSAQLGLRWGLDLFGRERAALDAAIGRARAAEADAQAARVALSSAVVAAYVDLARLEAARGVAQESLAQREQVLVLVRQRVAAGLDTQVELKQAEGLIAQSQVEIESIAEAAGRARRALAELTGQGPQALDGLVPALAALQPLGLSAGLPADLVGRRPDLVALRWRVEAALRDADVARTQFYPDVDLTAFVGLSSLGLDRFLEAGSRTFGAGPALHLPVFDGGRLRANLAARGAEADAAIDAWNGALLRAFREVADEVGTLQSVARQQQRQAVARDAADAAYDLALQRYRAGLGNFLVVLTAQGNVLQQRRLVTELQARQRAAEAGLARALGGGWVPAGTAPPAAVAGLPPLSAGASR